MGPQTRREYLARMRDRYVGANRATKRRLLDEAVTMTGYHRKSLKLVRKDRVGAWVRRRYDVPRTPLQRLQAAGVDRATLRPLDELARTLNLFELARRVDESLDRVSRLATFPRGRRPAPVTGILARRCAAG